MESYTPQQHHHPIPHAATLAAEQVQCTLSCCRRGPGLWCEPAGMHLARYALARARRLMDLDTWRQVLDSCERTDGYFAQTDIVEAAA